MKIFSLNKSYLENGLSSLGEICYIFLYYKLYKNDATKRMNKLVEKFYLRKPDIFLFHKVPDISYYVFKKLKDASPKTKFVMIMWDQRGGVHHLVKERISIIDLLLVNNYDVYQFKQYTDLGIPFVKPFYDSICPAQFHPIDQERQYDIFFGGNRFKHNKFPLCGLRYELIKILNSKYNTVVYGNGWPFKTNKIVRKSLYNDVLNTAKINIGINHYNTIRYYEERLFENMGSGRLHMTYYIPGIEHDFVNHKHLVWFNSVKECCELIEYYLAHEEERSYIEKSGRDLLLQKHTHKHRAIQLQNYFREILNT